jgi:hypothetical protein
MYTLNHALEQLQSPPSNNDVLTLPIAHLTTAPSFKQIAETRELRTDNCKYFNRPLLYFSYGGVFHRHGRQVPSYEPFGHDDSSSGEESFHAPVAILFAPNLLDKINCFFPYDTGAAHTEKYGSFNDSLSQFDQYKVSRISSEELHKLTSKFVYNFYNTNRQYLKGSVSQEAEKRISSLESLEPSLQHLLMTLLKFLKATIKGVDHRQRAIECQASESILLNKEIFSNIIWIGLPDLFSRTEFLEICRSLGGEPVNPPDYYFYEFHSSRVPSEFTADLESRAKDIIIKRYCQG